jgi:hypothetical protein
VIPGARLAAMTGAQFEISIDGVPIATGRRPRFTDRAGFEIQNPNSVVRLKDLQTGQEIVSRSN